MSDAAEPADNADAVTPAEVPATPSDVTEAPADVVETLTPEETEARNRFVTLMNWLFKVNDALDGLSRSQGLQGAIMLTRRDETCFWEQTGFITDKNKVYVKIGHHETSKQHYQPIGEIRGCAFYPTQASKLVWVRDFAVAPVHSFVGAFTVEKVEAPETDEDRANPSYLDDQERAKMVPALKALQEEMELALSADSDEKRTEAKERLVDTVRLVAIRCPKLNARLALEVQKNPEIKSDYSGAEPFSFAGAALDFLRMKLNDDSVRRHYKGTTLISQESSSLDLLLGSLIGKFEEVLTAPVDLVKAAALIEASATLYPPVQNVVAPFRDTDQYGEAAAIILGFLRLERSKLISTN